jgi:hypothetical protein
LKPTTSRQIRTLARRVAKFDWYDEKRRMHLEGRSAVCVLCRVEYAVHEGMDPAAICDSCAPEIVAVFAREIARCLK